MALLLLAQAVALLSFSGLGVSMPQVAVPERTLPAALTGNKDISFLQPLLTDSYLNCSALCLVDQSCVGITIYQTRRITELDPIFWCRTEVDHKNEDLQKGTIVYTAILRDKLQKVRKSTPTTTRTTTTTGRRSRSDELIHRKGNSVVVARAANNSSIFNGNNATKALENPDLAQVTTIHTVQAVRPGAPQQTQVVKVNGTNKLTLLGPNKPENLTLGLVDNNGLFPDMLKADATIATPTLNNATQESSRPSSATTPGNKTITVQGPPLLAFPTPEKQQPPPTFTDLSTTSTKDVVMKVSMAEIQPIAGSTIVGEGEAPSVPSILKATSVPATVPVLHDLPEVNIVSGTTTVVAGEGVQEPSTVTTSSELSGMFQMPVGRPTIANLTGSSQMLPPKKPNVTLNLANATTHPVAVIVSGTATNKKPSLILTTPAPTRVPESPFSTLFPIIIPHLKPGRPEVTEIPETTTAEGFPENTEIPDEFPLTTTGPEEEEGDGVEDEGEEAENSAATVVPVTEKNPAEKVREKIELLKNLTLPFTDVQIPTTTTTTIKPLTAERPHSIESQLQTPSHDELLEGDGSEKLAATEISFESERSPEEEFLPETTTTSTTTTMRPIITVVTEPMGPTTEGPVIIDETCLFSDSERFKRGIAATVYSNLNHEPTLLSFVNGSDCVGTFSKSGRKEVRSISKVFQDFPAKSSPILAGAFYNNNSVFLFDSDKEQNVWRYSFDSSTGTYKKPKELIKTREFLEEACGILDPGHFNIKAIAQLPGNDSSCIVFDSSSNVMISPNATEEASLLADAIIGVLETEFVDSVESVFAWLDEPDVCHVYLFGSNEEVYEVYRDASTDFKWKRGAYRIVPYEDFPYR